MSVIKRRIFGCLWARVCFTALSAVFVAVLLQASEEIGYDMNGSPCYPSGQSCTYRCFINGVQKGSAAAPHLVLSSDIDIACVQVGGSATMGPPTPPTIKDCDAQVRHAHYTWTPQCALVPAGTIDHWTAIPGGQIVEYCSSGG